MPDSETQSTYVFGNFRLMPEHRQLQGAEGENVILRGKVFDLLWYLVRNRGRLVGKAELMDALWADTIVEENNLNQSISALRQALGDDVKTPTYIATVKGRGYQFVGDVSRESSAGGEDAQTINTALAARTRPRLLLISATVVAIAAFLWIYREPEVLAPGSPVFDRLVDATLSIVTDFPGSHREPTLSPDGRMMAYVSDIDGTPQIWVKNLQRGDPIQVTHGPFPAGSPTWSPNDDQIFFERTTPEGISIYRISALGSSDATMIVEYGTAPKYAKHSNAFVYSTGRKIWIAKNDGRDREEILGVPTGQGFAAREPALSPDGKLIAFIHADEGPIGNLWIVPVEGGGARQLTTQEMSGGFAGAPEWSADGKSILFSIDAGLSGGQLWRFDIDSAEATALTTGAGGARDVVISSDGKRIAYTAARTMWKLTRVDPRTKDTSTIYESRTPVLLPIASPDGTQIVFFMRNSTGMQIGMIDSDGENLRQLTFDEPGENALPTWSADGTAILYYRGRSLHRLSPSDGSDTQIFADFHWSSRNWLTASGNSISYHFMDRPAGVRRTVVKELGESAEIELPVPIEAAQWKADGKVLVGSFRQTGELLICEPYTQACRNLENDGENVLGMRPMWSNDDRWIYFLRRNDEGECCTLWRIDGDGGNKTQIAELAGYELQNSYYGVDANGMIFYNHLDRSTDEIWLAKIDDF